MPAFNSPFIAPQPFHIAIPQLQTSQGAQWVPRFRKHHQNELSSHDCNTNGHKVSQVWTTHDDIVTPNWKHDVCNKWDMSLYYHLLLTCFLHVPKCLLNILSNFPNMSPGSNIITHHHWCFFFQDFRFSAWYHHRDPRKSWFHFHLWCKAPISQATSFTKNHTNRPRFNVVASCSRAPRWGLIKWPRRVPLRKALINLRIIWLSERCIHMHTQSVCNNMY